MRIAIVINMIAPYTTPVFSELAKRPDCELLVVYETPMEPSRQWQPETQLPYRHAVLRSWTLDLARLAVGSGVKSRYDTYLYIPKRPLATLSHFAPEAVVAAGAGLWSSPANIAALAARAKYGWAFVPWWGSFRRQRPTLPRRLAEPWVRTFIRSGDAWLAYGKRSRDDLVDLGADPARIAIAPLVARPAPLEVRAQSGARTSSRELRYLFVGRLIEAKGIDILLEAFRSVEGGELWIAGSGPLSGLVERAAQADARVRVFGHLGASELHDLYRQVDVLVLPSRHDVWGLVVNEAQEYGLPVIATDWVGAAEDLVDPGVNGLVVPADEPESLSDAMREIARWTDDQRRRCAERCRAKLEARSLARAGDAIIDACSVAVEHRRIRKSRGRRVRRWRL
jgi:glycosyltransferase involved in cell wall biosynthesis